MLKEDPSVSVLMTVYNREKYIAEAIESVLASSFSEFELIIVDDCSEDRSVEIAKTFAHKDSRIKVHENETNLGDYPNRNKAASLAKGKYLKYVDADDMIYPHGLEVLVSMMEQFPNVGYGLCSLEQDIERIFPFQLSPQEAYQRHYFEKSLFHKAPLSSMIRVEAFKAVGGFSGKQHVGDFELWHVLSQSYPVVLMPHGVVWYREHDDQQMNDNRTDCAVPFKYKLLGAEMLNSPQCPLGDQEISKALKNEARCRARYILCALKEHGPKKARELLKMANISIPRVLFDAFSH
jgi:glycosyltransferase involved in cell wall biosynthesis